MGTSAKCNITGKVIKLHTRDYYEGRDQVHNANGVGMTIQYVGHSIMHTSRSSLRLHNI
jgi:hypothetical protein